MSTTRKNSSGAKELRRSNTPAKGKTATTKVAERTKRRAKNASRSYSSRTLKIIWGLSGNQCAYPGCTNPLIAEGTKLSDAAIIGHICHIYAFSENGPRGKKGFSTKEKNSAENLILMCGHHHPLVDKQYKEYPAATLIGWKRAHEAKMHPGTAEAIKHEADLDKHAFLQQRSDDEISKALDRLRSARFLNGFPVLEETRALANSVIASKFSGGSNEMRARALAWCARLLVDTPEGSDLLTASKQLATTPEGIIAQAYFTAPNDKAAALKSLAGLGSPEARSAALRIVITADGAQAGIDWCRKSGLNVGSFDADGKFFYISNALGAQAWDIAIEALPGIDEHDYVQCPGLLHAAAMVNLTIAIPEDFRVIGMNQVPFNASNFELLSGASELVARQRAITLFERISTFAQEMRTAAAANIASDYALWLRLRDPTGYQEGMERLRESMRNPTISLRRVHLAVHFGVEIDRVAIETLIDQDVALTGKGTADAAYARFALAFGQGGHKGLAEYIDKHRAQLYEHLVKSSVQGIEIEALARAGLVDTANKSLAVAKMDGMPPQYAEFLARVIAEASGADPIAERRAFYKTTGDLNSLLNLVIALQGARLWGDLLPYAQELLVRSRSAINAERVAAALDALGNYGELFDFLLDNRDLVEQSAGLLMLWAWTLYREGRFSDATSALTDVPPTDPNARALRVNVAIASGQWDKLVEFCNETWLHRDRHSAIELLHTAQLSIAVNGNHSRDLLGAAAEKDPTNAHLLAAAYFEAVKGGMEHNKAIRQWLATAAQLSGNSGPLKSMSLKEIIDLKPEWDRNESNVWDHLFAGRIPVFAAAHILNRSLIDFCLTPALLNPIERDVRKRSVIFAYSGRRGQVSTMVVNSIALDLAAILTLARTNLLDLVIANFDVLVPHSTLGWLFRERQRATFHQPSRIRDAKQIKQLIASDTLKVRRSGTSPDAKLANEVGADRAGFLSLARLETESGRRTLVVHGAPFQKFGSFANEPANISGYESIVCSSFAVVERLKNRAALTAVEEERALSFLKLHETRWPNEPSIDDDTTVYLDQIALSHLQAVGVLDKFILGGVSAFIAEEGDDEADALVALGSLGSQKLDSIEAIRTALANGIQHGRVRAVRSASPETDDEAPFKMHPTYSVLTLADEADALVVDDRYINQHQNIKSDKATTPLLCTLDLIQILKDRGALSASQAYEYRTILRQAGYHLISVADDELEHHLKGVQVRGGELVETAELRAIRESMMRARISKLLQIPTEAPFLHQTLGAFIRAIKQKWVTATEIEEAKAFGRYLLPLTNVRAWAGSAVPGNERGFAQVALGSHVLQIMTPPLGIADERREAFFEWITDVLLKPLKESEPDIFKWLVAQSKELAIRGAEQAIDDSRQRSGVVSQDLRAAMLSISLRLVPPIVRDDLLSDYKLVQRFGLATEAVITLPHIASFQRSAISAAVRKAVRKLNSTATTRDLGGGVWQVKAFPRRVRPSVILRKGEASVEANYLLLVGGNRRSRLTVLELNMKKFQIGRAVGDKWRKLVRARPLSEGEMVQFTRDLSLSPVFVSATVTDSLTKHRISPVNLVPHSLAYYEGLVGVCNGQRDIFQYVAEVGVPFVQSLLGSGVHANVALALLLGSHSAFSRAIADAAQNKRVLTKTLRGAQSADVLSQCAAIEVAFASGSISEAGATALLKLATDFCKNFDGVNGQAFTLLSAAFVLVYGELAHVKSTASMPPFWRRLAAFAQAALISRSLKSVPIDVPSFAKWMTGARVHEFVAQCYVDMRTDPRCSEDFASPNQLMQELGGRVLLAACTDVRRTNALGLKSKLLGNGRRSLKTRIDLMLAQLPGPLEGNVMAQHECPLAELDKCRQELRSGAPKVEMFGRLINAAQYYALPEALPNLAADALKHNHYRLDSGGDREKLASYLTGLATVAAVTRNRRLADELFVTIRNYCRRFKSELAIGAAINIGLIASASREDLSDWAECVGEFTLDLSHSILTPIERNTISSLIGHLCELVPELWAACSRALAALEAAAAA